MGWTRINLLIAVLQPGCVGNIITKVSPTNQFLLGWLQEKLILVWHTSDRSVAHPSIVTKPN